MLIQTDGQINYVIDANQEDKKESDIYPEKQPRKLCFCIFTFLPLQPNRQTVGQNIYRINAHR